MYRHGYIGEILGSCEAPCANPPCITDPVYTGDPASIETFDFNPPSLYQRPGLYLRPGFY